MKMNLPTGSMVDWLIPYFGLQAAGDWIFTRASLESGRGLRYFPTALSQQTVSKQEIRHGDGYRNTSPGTKAKQGLPSNAYHHTEAPEAGGQRVLGGPHPPDALFRTSRRAIKPRSTAGLLRFRYHVRGTYRRMSPESQDWSSHLPPRRSRSPCQLAPTGLPGDAFEWKAQQEAASAGQADQADFADTQPPPLAAEEARPARSGNCSEFR